MVESGVVAVLDFGSQYTHLLARRVRELGVRSEIVPNYINAFELSNCVGLILSGGPRSFASGERLEFDKEIFNLGIPILGLCYGHQLMADFFNGSVERSGKREYGIASLEIDKEKELLKGLPTESRVWMSHGDHVERLPAGFEVLGRTQNGAVAVMGNSAQRLFGLQFHPEVHHTEYGKHILRNFVLDICEAQTNWQPSSMVKKIKEDIVGEVGGRHVFMLISGGVDSLVSYALLTKALGTENVTGLHIDNGFMRKNESDAVVEAIAQLDLGEIKLVDSADVFFSSIDGVCEPETKRKNIGRTFIKVAEREMGKLGLDFETCLLGQGTIYPDRIETGDSKHSDTIKTHHNRVDKVQQLIDRGQVIEPLKDLYKDEVRRVGLELGLPENLIKRHPFPGPGLAIRCLASDKNDERSEKMILPSRVVEGKNVEVIKLPVRSVGVQGDERTYLNPAVIIDKEQQFTWDEYLLLSNWITNHFSEVNRVLLPLLGNIESVNAVRIKNSTTNRQRVELLRQVDDIVNRQVMGDTRCDHVWQMPIVLVPMGTKLMESIIIRPIESVDAMTASVAKLPDDILNKTIQKIGELGGIDYVFYDLTNKPPGTIEWE